jgi:hypothetical protein
VPAGMTLQTSIYKANTIQKKLMISFPATKKEKVNKPET